MGSDVFLIQQGGAATLGYGVMGMFELRSRAWEELRLPSIMALVVNAISLVVTILSALARESLLLPLVVFLVSTVATVGYLVLLRRQGK
jgi:hypothetical protein